MVDINDKQRGLRQAKVVTEACRKPELRRAAKESDLCPRRALGADETDLHPLGCWEGEALAAIGCLRPCGAV